MYISGIGKGTSIFAHILIWSLLGFVLLFYPPLTWHITVPRGFWGKQVFNLILFVAAFYINLYWVAPRLLFRKNKLAFVGWFILAAIAMLVMARIVEVKLNVLASMAALWGKGPKSFFTIDVYLLMVCLVVLSVSTMIALVERWQQDARLHELREKQQIASELALLKAQINPHFFFNTLNNIYALTFSDVPVSREAILTLSRMMRYVLYDTLHDVAPLSQEISFLNNFVSLMKLRLHERTTLEYEVSEPDKDYAIAPMLLLPFIENAFKHGTSALQKAKIEISLSAGNGQLELRVFNHISHEKDTYNLDKGGIGLMNTEKRLSLLYPNKHKLRIREDVDQKTYEIVLNLDLRIGPEERTRTTDETELHYR